MIPMCAASVSASTADRVNRHILAILVYLSVHVVLSEIIKWFRVTSLFHSPHCCEIYWKHSGLDSLQQSPISLAKLWMVWEQILLLMKEMRYTIVLWADTLKRMIQVYTSSSFLHRSFLRQAAFSEYQHQNLVCTKISSNTFFKVQKHRTLQFFNSRCDFSLCFFYESVR